jgi:mRNA interferase RelE/StbE
MRRSRKRGAPRPEPEPTRYEIVLTRAAERGLVSLPKADFRRVDTKIRGLAEAPRPPGAKKLEGVGGLYRVRSGDYRIIYQIEDARRVVVIVDVGNRRDIYQDL